MSWIDWNSNKKIETIEDLPDKCYGFVYRIDNMSKSKSYIGKKSCFSVTKKRFGKRKLAQMTDKRLKKYEIVRKPNDWLKYIGSNRQLKEDVESGDEIRKYILDFAFSKYHLTYLEVKYQIVYEVLENENWYNDNILGKFYPSIFDFNKEEDKCD